MGDLFTVTAGCLPASAKVMGFRGREALSQLYEVFVYVSVDHGGGDSVDLADAVGSRITLTMHPPNALAELVGLTPAFHISGIVRDLELASDVSGRSVFRATIVPQLWLLSHSIHSRVFTNKSVPEIIEATLQDNGLSGEDYELRLSKTYAIEEHVAQYKESDFAFLSRWMEREGMYYFFEHGEGSEKLVICDDASAHGPLRPMPVSYDPADGDVMQKEGFHSLALRRTALAANVTVSDYDYAKPALTVNGSAPVSPLGVAEIVVHSDRFFTPAEGKRLAAIRAEALRATETVINANGTARLLRPGYTFDLQDHPRGEVNQKYLPLSVEHIGRQTHGPSELDELISDKSPDVYRVSVQAIPHDVQFRSKRTTPWPKIDGFENGSVCGATTSNYAQIDDQGRYSIKLFFDEGTLRDGKASTLVRMAQPHGGSTEGFHFPLRKGTEVLVEFLDGDPDRPLIAAVLPTMTTPSPVTSGNNTKNVLQTGGSTRLQIEDAAGGQYMHTTTPVQNTSMYMGTDASSKDGHHVELTTGGSGGHSFGTYVNEFVGGYRTEHVVADNSRNYGANYTSSVLGNVQQSYDADQSTTVVSNVIRTVIGTLGDTVEGVVTRDFSATWNLSVTADATETFQANSVLKVKGDQTVTINGKATNTIQGSLTETVNGLHKHVANASYNLEATPDAKFHATANVMIRGDAKASLSAPPTTVNGDTSVEIHGGSKVDIVSPSVTLNGSAAINLNGGTIEITGGDISIVGGAIDFEASGPMELKADGPLMAIAGGAATISGGPMIDAKAGLITLAIVGPPSTGLGADVDAIVAMSPLFMQNIQAILANGVVIEYGPAGDGSYFTGDKIVIDGSLKGNPTAVAGVLAHESGHALYTQGYTPPDGLTRQQYVDTNVNHSNKNEAEATLTNIGIRNELLNAGGPDVGINGSQSAQYQQIYDKYPNPADRDTARQEIANVWGNSEVPSVKKDDGSYYTNYNDYYGTFYGNWYDTNVGGGGP